MEHRIKITPNHFINVKRGLKKAEIRKNDRNYKDGDILVLCEWNDHRHFKCYTGRELRVRVTHILHGGKYGIQEGYCVMSIKRIQK